MILDRLYRLQRENRELRRKYQQLSGQYYDTAAALEREQERSSRAFLAATEPCPMCEEVERERNDALLEADTAKAELDEVRAALHWLERDFKVS